MDDTVYRQAAIDAFLTELTKRERKNLLHTWSTVEVKYFITDMLEQLPSAQSEIIHCRDCEKYGTKFCSIDIWTDQVTIRRAKPDGFCNYAKRREEGEQDD